MVSEWSFLENLGFLLLKLWFVDGAGPWTAEYGEYAETVWLVEFVVFCSSLFSFT